MKTHNTTARRINVKNESGSTLVIVLMVIGLVGLMAAASMSLATYLAQDKTRTKHLGQVDAFAQRLTALTTDPATCTGVAGALPRALQGLQFYDGASYTKVGFSASPDSKQEVRIQTNSADVAADHFLGVGSPTEGMPTISTQSLFIQNVNPSGPNAYTADLGFRLTVDGQLYADRKVGQIYMQFAAGPLPGSAMTSCELSQSAQIVCENMGCKYTAGATGLKCKCGLPAMSCATANPWRDYIVGVNASVDPPTPICRTLKVSCIDKKGPGFVLAGVDEAGQPICQPLEGSPAVTCPYGGTATTGAGAPAAPAGCFCAASGETWNGAGCVPPPACSIAGTSLGGQGAAAPASGPGCKCNNASDTWNGATCVPPPCVAPMVWDGTSCDYDRDPCRHIGDACTIYEANSASFNTYYYGTVDYCGCADTWADALAGVRAGRNQYDYTVSCVSGAVAIQQAPCYLWLGSCVCR